VVIGAVIAILVALCVTIWFGRPRRDSILDHRRAIETLREIAERPRVVPEAASGVPHYPTDHVQFLPEPPAHVGRDRRSSSFRTAHPARPLDMDYSSRPTIARLPTIGPALHLEQLAVGSASVVGEDDMSGARQPVVLQPEGGE
jgi:hypothetical protein